MTTTLLWTCYFKIESYSCWSAICIRLKLKQAAQETQDLSFAYLALHELESIQLLLLMYSFVNQLFHLFYSSIIKLKHSSTRNKQKEAATSLQVQQHKRYKHCSCNTEFSAQLCTPYT